MRKAFSFLQSSCGVAAIEAAVIIPVIVLITFAVLEFGMYYFKSNIIQNTISAAISPLQMDPEDPTIRDEMINSGGSFLGLAGGNGNYVCAIAYRTYQEAKGGGCSGAAWNTADPDPNNEDPYYITLAAKTDNPISLFFDLDNIRQEQIVRIGGQLPITTCGDSCLRIGDLGMEWGIIDIPKQGDNDSDWGQNYTLKNIYWPNNQGRNMVFFNDSLFYAEAEEPGNEAASKFPCGTKYCYRRVDAKVDGNRFSYEVKIYGTELVHDPSAGQTTVDRKGVGVPAHKIPYMIIGPLAE